MKKYQIKEYSDFCSENDLKTRSERIRIASWDRQQAAEARGAARRYGNELEKKKAGASAPKVKPDISTVDVPLQSGGKDGMEKISAQKEAHATLYYEEVRNRKDYSDAKQIVKNVEGFSEQDIEEIRHHVFIDKIPRSGKLERFDPSFEQAQVWQRLVEGKNIKKSDIIFLKHEKKELTIMRDLGYNYEEAHNIADEEFNWWKSVLEDDE